MSKYVIKTRNMNDINHSHCVHGPLCDIHIDTRGVFFRLNSYSLLPKQKISLSTRGWCKCIVRAMYRVSAVAVKGRLTKSGSAALDFQPPLETESDNGLSHTKKLFSKLICSWQFVFVKTCHPEERSSDRAPANRPHTCHIGIILDV